MLCSSSNIFKRLWHEPYYYLSLKAKWYFNALGSLSLLQIQIYSTNLVLHTLYYNKYFERNNNVTICIYYRLQKQFGVMKGNRKSNVAIAVQDCDLIVP